jgi:hypothetical protein
MLVLSRMRVPGEAVELSVELCARSIKPLPGRRPWQRRTRALWRLNGRRQAVVSPRMVSSKLFSSSTISTISL